MGSFDEFYLKHAPKIYAYAYKHFHNKFDAENIVQETFAAAVAKWDTLVAHENPVGWLYVAAGYCIFDEYARQHPEDVIFVPLENCQEIEHRDSEPLAIVIQDLLDGLTDKEKVVTVQYYFLGYSIKEISENLHISQGTVKKRMQRARDRIRERNKDEEKI